MCMFETISKWQEDDIENGESVHATQRAALHTTMGNKRNTHDTTQ